MNLLPFPKRLRQEDTGNYVLWLDGKGSHPDPNKRVYLKGVRKHFIVVRNRGTYWEKSTLNIHGVYEGRENPRQRGGDSCLGLEQLKMLEDLFTHELRKS